MSNIYNNQYFSSLIQEVRKDYTFSLFKLSIEKDIPINHDDILKLDKILIMNKDDQPLALKQVFIDISART